MVYHTVTPKARLNFKQPPCCCHCTKTFISTPPPHPPTHPQKSCIFFEELVPYIICNPMLSSTATAPMHSACALHSDSINKICNRGNFHQNLFFASSVKLMFCGLSPFYKMGQYVNEYTCKDFNYMYVSSI